MFPGRCDEARVTIWRFARLSNLSHVSEGESAFFGLSISDSCHSHDIVDSKMQFLNLYNFLGYSKQVVATWRPDAGRRPCIEEAPVFYPTEEVFLHIGTSELC